MTAKVVLYEDHSKLGFYGLSSITNLGQLIYTTASDTSNTSYVATYSGGVFNTTYTFKGTGLTFDMTDPDYPTITGGTITSIKATINIHVTETSHASFKIKGLNIDAADMVGEGGANIDYYDMMGLFFKDGIHYVAGDELTSEYLNATNSSNEAYRAQVLNGDDILDFSGATSLTNNVISSMGGNDTVIGSGARDNIYGGAGKDTLTGNDGFDYITGDGGNDFIYGGADSDNLYGGAKSDVLKGGSAEDYLYGGTSSDTLYGGKDDDQLFGDGGNDSIKGGAGTDYIYGGSGQDVLDGGTGSDLFFFDDASGKDVLHGFDTDTELLIIETAENIRKKVVDAGILVKWGNDNVLVVDVDNKDDVSIQIIDPV